MVGERFNEDVVNLYSLEPLHDELIRIHIIA